MYFVVASVRVVRAYMLGPGLLERMLSVPVTSRLPVDSICEHLWFTGGASASSVAAGSASAVASSGVASAAASAAAAAPEMEE